MTYVRLPSPTTAAPAASPHIVDGKKECSKCHRWLPLYDFESKGIRAGRQERRGRPGLRYGD